MPRFLIQVAVASCGHEVRTSLCWLAVPSSLVWEAIGMQYRIAVESAMLFLPAMPVHNQSLRHNGPPDPAGRASNATSRFCVLIRPKAGSLSVLLPSVSGCGSHHSQLVWTDRPGTCDYGLWDSGLSSGLAIVGCLVNCRGRERNHPFLATSRCCGLSLLATDPWTSPAVSFWCCVPSCHMMQFVSLLRR